MEMNKTMNSHKIPFNLSENGARNYKKRSLSVLGKVNYIQRSYFLINIAKGIKENIIENKERKKRAFSATNDARKEIQIKKIKNEDEMENKFIQFIQTLMNQETLCNEHKKEFTFYCHSDSMFCCLDCVHISSNHKSHHLNLLRVLYPEMKQKVQNFMKSSAIIIHDNQKLINRYQQEKEKLLKSHSDSIRNIKIHYKNLIDTVFDCENKALAEADMLYSKYNQQCDKIIEEIKVFNSFLDPYNSKKGIELSAPNIPQVFKNIGVLEMGIEAILQRENKIPKSFDISQKFSNIESVIENISSHTIFPEFHNYPCDIKGKYYCQEKKKIFKKDEPKHLILAKSIKYHEGESIDLDFIGSQKISNPLLFNESQIINNEKMKIALINMMPKQLSSTSLLYSMIKNGLSPKTFHSLTDGKGPYIVLIYANKFFKFGYYCPISFKSIEKYETSNDFWIFQLTNSKGISINKFPVKRDKTHISFHQSSESPCLGSILDGKHDLWINLLNPEKSCSNLGYAYDCQENSSSLLAGSQTNWTIHNIEVYNVHFK